MKRRSVELERREWREKSDPQRVVIATLTWCPTDRENGYPARYRATLCNVRREPVCFAGRSVGVWESGSPYESTCLTLFSLPHGARRCKFWEDKALARFEAFVADYLPDYVARYSLSIDAATPSACVP